MKPEEYDPLKAAREAFIRHVDYCSACEPKSNPGYLCPRGNQIWRVVARMLVRGDRA